MENKMKSLQEMQEEILRRIYDETLLLVSEKETAQERFSLLREASAVFSIAGVKMNAQKEA